MPHTSHDDRSNPYSTGNSSNRSGSVRPLGTEPELPQRGGGNESGSPPRWLRPVLDHRGAHGSTEIPAQVLRLTAFYRTPSNALIEPVRHVALAGSPDFGNIAQMVLPRAHRVRQARQERVLQGAQQLHSRGRCRASCRLGASNLGTPQVAAWPGASCARSGAKGRSCLVATVGERAARVRLSVDVVAERIEHFLERVMECGAQAGR